MCHLPLLPLNSVPTTCSAHGSLAPSTLTSQFLSSIAGLSCTGAFDLALPLPGTHVSQMSPSVLPSPPLCASQIFLLTPRPPYPVLVVLFHSTAIAQTYYIMYLPITCMIYGLGSTRTGTYDYLFTHYCSAGIKLVELHERIPIYL